MLEMRHSVKPWLVLLLLLPAFRVPIASGQQPELDSDATRVWIAANRQTAIDLLLPPPTLTEDMTLDTAWAAIIRVTPSGLGTEFYMRLAKSYSGKLSAHIIRPADGSITSQLSRIHVRQPDLSVAEAVALVQMRTQDVTDAQAPLLRRAAQDLERTRGQYVFDNVLMLDATRYELWTMGGPRRMYITLLGPNAGETIPKLPLLNVLVKIRRLAETIR